VPRNSPEDRSAAEAIYKNLGGDFGKFAKICGDHLSFAADGFYQID
jgi:hypothetical protein